MRVWPSWAHDHPCLEGVQHRGGSDGPVTQTTYTSPWSTDYKRRQCCPRRQNEALLASLTPLELSLEQRVMPGRALLTSVSLSCLFRMAHMEKASRLCFFFQSVSIFDSLGVHTLCWYMASTYPWREDACEWAQLSTNCLSQESPRPMCWEEHMHQ